MMMMLIPVLLLAASTGSGASLDLAPQARTNALAAYRNLPRSFEAIDGAFVTRGDRYAVVLRPGGGVLYLRKSQLRMNLVGADPRAHATGSEPLPGRVNYFVGSDASRWRTNAARYARLRFSNVYPGIDVVYYGNQRRLEYDFVVAAGARPDVIRLQFDGAQSVRHDANGDLVVKTSNDEIRLHKPHVYQQSASGRRPVESRYVLASNHRIRFKIGDYDRSKELVIDPVLSYSTYLGGTLGELGNAIAVDSSGNAYVTGSTASTNFPTTTGAFRRTGTGQDAFVTKIDSNGAFVYSTYLGGDRTDTGNGIAVDSAGNAYITGQTNSTNFPVTTGALKTTNSGNIAFVTKLNPAGSALVYSTYLGGTSTDRARAIAIDPSGNAYVTGLTTSTDFPVTAGAVQPTRRSNDAFVSKLNPAGTALVFSTYLGGSQFQDEGFGIAADSAGNAYVTGKTDSTDFPVTSGAFITTAPGGHDAFVTKLNANGTALVYSTYLGGRGEDRGNAIVVDSAGNAYVTGYTYATDFPTMAAVQPNCGCRNSIGGRVQSDAFVTKLAPSGAAILYSTFYGGDGPDSGTGIGLDGAGAIYFGGTTNGISPSNFPLVDSLKPTKGILDDAFAVRLNADGSAAVYSTFFGGETTDFAAAVAVDAAGNVYLTGNTNSGDMPTTAGAAQRTRGGGDDAFVVRIGTGAAAAPSISAAGVVNGASFAAGASAGGIVSVFGTGLAPSTVVAPSVPLPATLAGTSFQLGGQPVPLFFVSPLQANIQVPWELAGQAQVSMTATTAGGTSSSITLPLAAVSPGIFTMTQTGSGQGAILIANSDIIAAPAGSIAGRTTRPARRGEFISIYCTGMGPVNNRPASGAQSQGSPLAETTSTPTVTIGGTQASVSFSGLAPGFVGLYQVNVQVPDTAPVGDAVTLRIRIGGVDSNTVTLAVQ